MRKEAGITTVSKYQKYCYEKGVVETPLGFGEIQRKSGLEVFRETDIRSM